MFRVHFDARPNRSCDPRCQKSIFLPVLWHSDTNRFRVKVNFNWRVFLAVPFLGVCPAAFGQANPQLVCDSISASKSKCGFGGFMGSKRFLKATASTVGSYRLGAHRVAGALLPLRRLTP